MFVVEEVQSLYMDWQSIDTGWRDIYLGPRSKEQGIDGSILDCNCDSASLCGYGEVLDIGNEIVFDGPILMDVCFIDRIRRTRHHCGVRYELMLRVWYLFWGGSPWKAGERRAACTPFQCSRVQRHRSSRTLHRYGKVP